MRLLLLEDDVRLCRSFARRFRDDGYAVDEVCTLAEARTALIHAAYDCLVLDRVVPDGDALDLVLELGDYPDRTPVLVVSGRRGGSGDRVVGLEAGADDYLSKPVRLDELSLRVRRLTTWAAVAVCPPDVVVLGAVRFDRGKREVKVNGETVHLTPTQYRVFAYLVAHRERLVSVEELLEHCWDRNRHAFANPVHSQVTRLRNKFEGALVFELVRGYGYAIRVAGPVTG